MIAIKCVYEAPAPQDGKRFLVERLWPRGMKKESLKMDVWLKEVAPSTELRRWFNHDQEKWLAFRRCYFEELAQKPEAVSAILKEEKHGNVTLLYSAHDTERNSASALKKYLRKQAAGNRKYKIIKHVIAVP